MRQERWKDVCKCALSLTTVAMKKENFMILRCCLAVCAAENDP